MSPNLFWISGPWPGRLAITARPRGGDWLSDEARGWKQAGLDVVVSLLEDDEAAELELSDEKDIAELNCLRFVTFPIPDRGVPNSGENGRKLLREITRTLEEGKNVGVHCRQGIGRSGMIAAGVLVGSGIKPEKAVKVVSAARGLAVPETRSQLEWIHHLAAEPREVAALERGWREQ